MTTLTGLSAAEVEDRRRLGLDNQQPPATSRTYKEICKDNLFTFINGVFFFISIVLLGLGRPGDVLVIAIVVFLNTILSLVQEVRAKQQLDQIALLTRPHVAVLRDGVEISVTPDAIVQDDVLVVRPGDQIIADGRVVGTGQIQVDESLLTGESDLINKELGDLVYSGSYCVQGLAYYQAEKVGSASTANQVTKSAKAFRRELTPLQHDINLIIRVILVLAMFLWILVLLSLLVGLSSFPMAVQTAAVVAGLVPVGLYLTITLTYAVGAVRIAKQEVLVQQANAMESLSNINVLCLDKTGTLTANALEVQTIHPLQGTEPELRQLLGRFAHSLTVANQTSAAIAQACAAPPCPPRLEIPFASSHKWSALAWADVGGVTILGAPDVLFPGDRLSPEILLEIETAIAHGTRVLMVAHSQQDPQWPDPTQAPRLPLELTPLGLVLLRDQLRPQSQEVLERFTQAGIGIKIISGDHPKTVLALAKQVGVGENLGGALRIISGAELAKMNPGEFQQAARETTIFGRITPEQKRQLVKALRDQGLHVAMIGDGVNDVLSLKEANIGIAMESGSAITRGVADIILRHDSFAALPAAFREGQRIHNGIQDVTRLFLVRVLSFSLLFMTSVIAGRAFPLLIKQNSLLTLFGVGIPTIGLALWAVPGPRQEKPLIPSLLHFVLPASLSLCLLGLLVYWGYLANQILPLVDLLQGTVALDQISTAIQRNKFREGIEVARSALVTVLLLASLVMILFLKPPHGAWVGGAPLSKNWRYPVMASLLLVGYVLILLIPGLRHFLELELLRWEDYGICVLIVMAWALILRSMWRWRLLDRFLGVSLS
ncbi:HAD-IC family P-type ATPase [Thermosynechococcaceae cyanobacterium BACA0444]|uniref:HAD-IC family P-type ATPase n=1 Tax=Pseudocalidococcus azoricus BACA0444 TaxID=2918990 RepID=A0AAE4FS74_9CYAN|nr:HAD-IC family P-type ATPase [Pseudocalidococcus azoricus]MDS3860357.1 HAD-IC family P-type ATPase [Pseudocalidococcus azoricus BACA0444]